MGCQVPPAALSPPALPPPTQYILKELNPYVSDLLTCEELPKVGFQDWFGQKKATGTLIIAIFFFILKHGHVCLYNPCCAYEIKAQLHPIQMLCPGPARPRYLESTGASYRGETVTPVPNQEIHLETLTLLCTPFCCPVLGKCQGPMDWGVTHGFFMPTPWKRLAE